SGCAPSRAGYSTRRRWPGSGPPGAACLHAWAWSCWSAPGAVDAGRIGRLRAPVHRLAIDVGCQHLELVQLARFDRQRVLRKQDEVGTLPDREAADVVLGKPGVRRITGEAAHGFPGGEFLLR